MISLAVTNQDSPNSVDQSNAKAAGDLVGRDKIGRQENHFYRSNSAVDRLLLSLKRQIDENETCVELIDQLMRYYDKKSIDGVDGLEAKLDKVNLSLLKDDALRKKERFVKFLDEWALYATAQELIAHALMKVENRFNTIVYPSIVMPISMEITASVIDYVVDPIVDEFYSEAFKVDQDLVFGMLYWLAEQCFVRWHSNAD